MEECDLSAELEQANERYTTVRQSRAKRSVVSSVYGARPEGSTAGMTA